MSRLRPRSTAGSSSTSNKRRGRRTGCDLGGGAFFMTQGLQQKADRFRSARFAACWNEEAASPVALKSLAKSVRLLPNAGDLAEWVALGTGPTYVLVRHVRVRTSNPGKDRSHPGGQHERRPHAVSLAREGRTRRAQRRLRFHSLIAACPRWATQCVKRVSRRSGFWAYAARASGTGGFGTPDSAASVLKKVHAAREALHTSQHQPGKCHALSGAAEARRRNSWGVIPVQRRKAR